MAFLLPLATLDLSLLDPHQAWACVLAQEWILLLVPCGKLWSVVSGQPQGIWERRWRWQDCRGGRASPRQRPATHCAPSLCSVCTCVCCCCLWAAASDVPQDGLLLHGPFARKPKRIRTAFSPSQLLRLERAFEKNHYVVGAERKQLAGSLSLSETQVSFLLPQPKEVGGWVQISLPFGFQKPPRCRVSGNPTLSLALSC